ncbi:MAG TPA: hypothetical protein VII41_01885 [Steroidobacteraceae bacterium]
MIGWPDGRRDTTSSVRWLQGLSACIDLRQPAAPSAATAAFTPERALDELSIDQCSRLARQQGFAGRCVFDGGYFEWIRSIDFQPCSPHADAGSLHWEGDVLVETGRDGAYLEHWHRESGAPTLPLAALALREANEKTPAAMLRVGPVFMFARDRTIAAAGHPTLGECVAAAATLRQAQALVDCEISFGSAEPGEFRVIASTLPWRVGDRLEPHFLGEQLSTMDRAANGRAITRLWEITDAEGDLDAAGAS